MNKPKYNASIFCIFNNECKNVMYIGWSTDPDSYFTSLRCKMSDHSSLKTKSIIKNSLSLFIRYVRYKDVMWNFEIIDEIATDNMTDIRDRIKYWENKMTEKFKTKFLNHSNSYNRNREDYNEYKREYYQKRKLEGKIPKFVSSEKRRTQQREVYHANKERYAEYRKKYYEKKKAEQQEKELLLNP